MLHVRVRQKLPTNVKIGPMAVAHQMGLLIDVSVNDGFQRYHLFVINGHSPHGAMALGCNEHSLLGRAFAALMDNALLGFWTATNVCFIQLNNTLEQTGVGAIRIHHFADGMAHAPRRWLRDPD